MVGAVALLVVYVLTLAPDVTFWDAGEFIAASRSLGIPHPPGTPLFVLLTNVWAKLLFFLPYAVATNLLSATCTAVAAGVTGGLVERATRNTAMAVAAALAAGGMSSVWLNATETEVYAASLALGVLMIWAGDRAGRSNELRWTYLTAYLIALSVPLHLSALVAAPVAILLAANDGDGLRWRTIAILGGVFVLVVGAGRVSVALSSVGALLVVVGAFVPSDRRLTISLLRDEASEDQSLSTMPLASTHANPAAHRVRMPIAMLMVALLGVSALAFLYLRARFDPAINQGNPDTLHALADVVARRQYAVSPTWPREAPLWVQLGNFGQYADWQVALSLGPTVLPSIPRTLGTVLFVGLGVEGGTRLWHTDRRLALALLTLFLCGSLGVLVYLNLHAGPSIGYGFLPENVVREARERDYFFVFAFWPWGVWAGVGAVSLMQRLSRRTWPGVLLACLPIALNWQAVSRRHLPERALPRVAAEAFLESAPRNAVLFVVGDNDTYPLWFAQQVLRVRTDVTVVTVPLLPTEWYRAELSRRHFLLTAKGVGRFDNRMETAAEIADAARRLGRPVAAAITLTPDERDRLGRQWTATGVTYFEGNERVDTAAALRWSRWVSERLPRDSVRETIDPVNTYFRSLLDCPRQLANHRAQGDTARLDSACNYR
ncbi:MAG TPA: DUF2723 domain-containing protein [Gemmatimonadaceae bacterium]|nr:DUF2723 domain-containing protein [Gemmatimonadaceae bacterium]